MLNHGLFIVSTVGVPALELALAAKVTRCSLISAARRAIANSRSSGVALVSPGLPPQEWLCDSEWGLGREVVPFCVIAKGAWGHSPAGRNRDTREENGAPVTTAPLNVPGEVFFLSHFNRQSHSA